MRGPIVAAGLALCGLAIVQPASAVECDDTLLKNYEKLWEGKLPDADISNVIAFNYEARLGSGVAVKRPKGAATVRDSVKEHAAAARDSLQLPEGERLRGFDKLDVEVVESVMLIDVCVVEWTATGDHTRVDYEPEQKFTAVKLKGVSALKLSGGKIVEEVILSSNDEEVQKTLEYK